MQNADLLRNWKNLNTDQSRRCQRNGLWHFLFTTEKKIDFLLPVNPVP